MPITTIAAPDQVITAAARSLPARHSSTEPRSPSRRAIGGTCVTRRKLRRTKVVEMTSQTPPATNNAARLISNVQGSVLACPCLAADCRVIGHRIRVPEAELIVQRQIGRSALLLSAVSGRASRNAGRRDRRTCRQTPTISDRWRSIGTASHILRFHSNELFDVCAGCAQPFTRRDAGHWKHYF